MTAPQTHLWRRIFVATDFSACSDGALSLAAWLSEQHGATLSMLHVSEVATGLEPDTVIQPAGSSQPVTVENYLISAASKRMREQAMRVLGRLPDTSRVALGSTPETIVQVAKEERADLLILGTHGRTGLNHFLVGSVAERVVRTAPCPVLVVRPPRAGDGGDEVARTPEEMTLDDETQG